MDFRGYFKSSFIYDLKAGFITAVVALPLAIAFAIASGVSPIMGLYTAVIAGMIFANTEKALKHITELLEGTLFRQACRYPRDGAQFF